MTFSLVARCHATGQLGVGAMTGVLGVGKLVAHARARTGAVATQAMINPYLGFDGLALMAEGVSAHDTLNRLLERAPGRAHRQCGLVDAGGGSAAWTGPEAPSWAGHRTGPGYSVQGNRLVGPETPRHPRPRLPRRRGCRAGPAPVAGPRGGRPHRWGPPGRGVGCHLGRRDRAVPAVERPGGPLGRPRRRVAGSVRAVRRGAGPGGAPAVHAAGPAGPGDRDLLRGQDPDASQ